MRVLILSAILACAAAAPSGALLGAIPVALPAFPALSAIPTISPGDLQAAVIDAKVQADDLIRSTAEKNLELAGQIVGDQKNKVLEANNLANEKNQEAFWEVQDKKWQTLTALQSAQAKLEGIVASNIDLLGQSILTAPGSGTPITYSSVLVKTGDNEKKEEPLVKKAEESKPQDNDSVQVEAVKDEKVAAAPSPKSPENSQSVSAEATVVPNTSQAIAPIALPKLIATPLAGLPLNYNGVAWQTAVIQPGLGIYLPAPAIH